MISSFKKKFGEVSYAFTYRLYALLRHVAVFPLLLLKGKQGISYSLTTIHIFQKGYSKGRLDRFSFYFFLARNEVSGCRHASLIWSINIQTPCLSETLKVIEAEQNFQNCWKIWHSYLWSINQKSESSTIIPFFLSNPPLPMCLFFPPLQNSRRILAACFCFASFFFSFLTLALNARDLS